MDDSLPDLVRDWELDTKFVSDKQTIHTTYVSDPARGRWRSAEEEVWDQMSMLGRGSFGVVSLQKCTSGPNSGNVRAVKEIQVTLDRSLDKFLSREISAIVKFSHKRFRECFVPSFGWYRGQDSIFITMEYLPLGDLQCYLNNPLPESEARTITEQTLQGIDFMHRSKIAHRDLKPKNILVQHKGPNWWVKLSDFGCSKQSESTSLRTIIGTEPYLAPELQNIFAPSDREDLEGEDDPDSPEAPGYSLAVDMWALGAITFRIITGRVPFPSPVGRKLSRYVAHGGSFPPDELLSSECMSFIVSAMSRSPRDRPSAAKALRDPWILYRCAPENVGSETEAGITAKPDTDEETLTDSPQTAFKDASGAWSTVIHSPPPHPKPVPDELHPDVNEASGTWSTIQPSNTLPPRSQYDISQSPHSTRLESPEVNEASGRWSTIQQSLPIQPKPLPDKSQKVESTQVTRSKPPDATQARVPRPTVQQDHPLQPNPASGGPGTGEPTRPQVSDTGNGSASTLIPEGFLEKIGQLPPVQIRSPRSFFPRMFPFHLTSALKTGRPQHYWKHAGFQGPPSEYVFSADDTSIVSVGKYGPFGGEAFCVWELDGGGKFQGKGAYYSTAHSRRAKMAFSLTAKRLIVVENGDRAMMHEEYCSTWEFSPRGVTKPVKGFGDSHMRRAYSWAISADTDRLFAAKKTDGASWPWKVIIKKRISHNQFESFGSKKFKSKVEDITCSRNGEQFVAFHNDSCTIFQSVGSRGYRVQLWPLIMPAGVRKWVSSAFSPDGQWSIISDDERFVILRLFPLRERRIWWSSAFATRAVVFSQDSKCFALGSLNGTISIWRLDKDDKFEEHKLLRLPIESQLRSLTFSPCGHFLATMTDDEFDVWEMF
ncbi:hypothetical protein BHE90_001980 [Fusarium euwallaceae]|uniref:mitogen-activated protein kinase kinase n=1 Tax=Fusarium euwallaceae TaxID=1147111 RepID=A0A430M698_9HYPO|nr:hypothetical protein BHE90_001980 [Fusarium euwallaceae]